MTNTTRPLQGVRILDFTWIGAGPLSTKLLAMYGAQVVKVESSLRMDIMRNANPKAPGKTGVNVSGEWNHFNGEKLGITVNMSTAQGREVVRSLAAISDVVSNSFAPGVLERWGLGFSDLVKIKPDIIALNMPVMGKNGPRRDVSGFGNGIAAMAGLNALMGNPGEEPVGFAIAYPDFSCNPYHAATAVMAALLYRDLTGKGQDIDLAQYESTINMVGPTVLDYTVNRRVQKALGNGSPYAAPHGAFRCQGDDRWCAIAVFTDSQWEGLCAVLGHPSWTADARFSTLLGRKRNEAEMNRLVEEWTLQRPPEEAMRLLQAQGVPAGVVQDTQDLLEKDPHLKAQGFFTLLDHPEAGLTVYQGPAFSLSETPGGPTRPAPLLGEHTQFVLQELLGMQELEYQRLKAEGVLE